MPTLGHFRGELVPQFTNQYWVGFDEIKSSKRSNEEAPAFNLSHTRLRTEFIDYDLTEYTGENTMYWTGVRNEAEGPQQMLLVAQCWSPNTLFRRPWLGTLFFQWNGAKMRIVMTCAIDIWEHRQGGWIEHGEWIEQTCSQSRPLQVVQIIIVIVS
jgi:hypothetical protein